MDNSNKAGGRRKVVGFARSNWTAEAGAKMAYTYLKAGGTPTDRAILGEGENGLYLAGEACSVLYPGSMHGAWFSGTEAADQIGGGRVIVVGAGLAGIAAGRRVKELGGTPVLLESGDEPFGRARGRNVPGVGSVLDGGMWLHGEQGHPLLGYVEAGQIGRQGDAWELSEEDPGNFAGTTYQGGTELGEARKSKLLAKISAIEEALDRHGETHPGGLREVLDQLLAGESVEDREVLETWLLVLYEGIVAGSVADMSVPHRFEPFVLPGRDSMLLRPVSDLKEDLLGEIDVAYRSKVVRITKTGNEWEVVCADGRRYRGDAVVLTVPVAVLEEISIRPSLSRRKKEALTRIGAGKLEKAWLVFEERFWGDNTEFYVAESGALANIFVDVSSVNKKPTLLAFIGAGMADEFSKLRDSEVISRIMHTLASVV